MGFDINDELKKTFDLATRRHEAKTFTTPEEWRSLQDITERHKRARSDTETRYVEEYDGRVEKAIVEILAEKSVPKNQIAPPIGAVRFDIEAIERQAHRRVLQDHEETLANHDQSEARETEVLLAQAAERRALQRHVEDDFTQAADRRSGTDRRIRRSRE